MSFNVSGESKVTLVVVHGLIAYNTSYEIVVFMRNLWTRIGIKMLRTAQLNNLVDRLTKIANLQLQTVVQSKTAIKCNCMVTTVVSI